MTTTIRYRTAHKDGREQTHTAERNQFREDKFLAEVFSDDESITDIYIVGIYGQGRTAGGGGGGRVSDPDDYRIDEELF